MNLFWFMTRNWSRKNSGRGRLGQSLGKRSALNLEPLERRELLSANLVAAYNFDEGAGSVLHDVSGNGNNGSITNATWSTAGKFGGALSFNGASDSFVTVNDSALLNLTAGMTLEAWVDPSTLNSLRQGWAAAISKENRSSQTNDVSYALYAAGGTNAPPTTQLLVGGNDQGPQG